MGRGIERQRQGIESSREREKEKERGVERELDR